MLWIAGVCYDIFVIRTKFDIYIFVTSRKSLICLHLDFKLNVIFIYLFVLIFMHFQIVVSFFWFYSVFFISVISSVIYNYVYQKLCFLLVALSYSFHDTMKPNIFFVKIQFICFVTTIISYLN